MTGAATASPPRNALLDALARDVAEYGPVRRLLVCRRLGEGRELLRALARTGTAWVGFEPATPWTIANALVAPAVAREGLRAADEFDAIALADEAIDGALAALADADVAGMAEGPGLRRALAGAIQALRLAGADGPTLRRMPLRDAARRDLLADMLVRYEAALARDRLTDAAGILRRALQALETGTAAAPEARVLIVPGQSRRGLSGRLLDALHARGATVLACEAPAGQRPPPALLVAGTGAEAAAAGASGRPDADTRAAPAPFAAGVEVELFTAASVAEELREVLRRVLAHGLHWDEVEIVATDAIAYGVALDGIARRLGIDVTHAVGLPVARTRPGRVVHAYLRWLRDGFPADLLRGLLERGDLAVADSPSGAALARRLRRLRIGRGRERTRDAVERAARQAASPAAEPDDPRTPEEQERDAERARAETAALATLVRTVLDATPAVPDRLRTVPVPVSAAALAQGLLTTLAFVPVTDDVDATAKSRLEERLRRLAVTATRETTMDAAVALLVARLDTRVPAPDAGGSAPWAASGGRLHLTDIETGGWTSRRATFVVGLDALRFPGGTGEDALLSDADRVALAHGQAVPALPTTADRIAERRWALAALLARLRGRVTLSWAAWDAAEARMRPPAPELLAAFRASSGRADAGYDDLRAALPLHSAIPRSGELDAEDAWLAALAHDGTLRPGLPLVRAAYAGLGRGLAAAEARAAPDFGAYHGRILPRAALDPRTREQPVSATALETLGTCPLRYLLRHVLGVRPPDDPVLDPDAWLSPLERGALLHDVFERTLRIARERGIDLRGPGLAALAVEILEAQVESWLERVPPPGSAVLAAEIDGLRDDVRAFARVVAGDGAPFIALEQSFGRGGAPPAEIPVHGRTLPVSGAIDRVDRRDEGLVVIDYKTGSTFGFARSTGTYRGGRRLQHAVYTMVAEALFAEPVARMEYVFPTIRGGAERFGFQRADLRRAGDVLHALLELAAAGRFHPTDAADDCRFCDFARSCRVRDGDRGTQSPPAQWVRAHLGHDAFATLRALRDGDFER